MPHFSGLAEVSPKIFQWNEMLFGEHHWTFVWETMFRSFIMFIIVLVGLRILGKRGVRQLSVFEMVVIIALGSAAGDPMFYKEVGLIPAIMVFMVIISMYYLVTFLVGKSKRFEHLVEGKPICLMEEGAFSIENFKKEPMAHDEFFAELRLKNVSQLGQIHTAIIETSGEISIFYYEDDEVKYGLPIMPGSFEEHLEPITKAGYYSCAFCAATYKLELVTTFTCGECGKHGWVKACNTRRIS